jgi:hypothetical protein
MAIMPAAACKGNKKVEKEQSGGHRLETAGRLGAAWIDFEPRIARMPSAAFGRNQNRFPRQDAKSAKKTGGSAVNLCELGVFARDVAL